MAYHSSLRVNSGNLTNRENDDLDDHVGIGIDYLSEHKATCFYSAYGGQEGLPNRNETLDDLDDFLIDNKGKAH